MTPDRFKWVTLGHAFPKATMSSVMKLWFESVMAKCVRRGNETMLNAFYQVKCLPCSSNLTSVFEYKRKQFLISVLVNWCR